MLRKLRIAFSAGCGIVCLSLIGLWALSYFYVVVGWSLGPSGCTTVLMSESGCLRFMRYPPPAGTPPASWQLWGCSPDTVPPLLQPFDFSSGQFVARSDLPFTWLPNGNTFYASLPHWPLVICGSAIALAPWFRARFSLRTLLIATTLVAVVLGLVVALR
jgi:hypothetical protein